MAEPGKYGGSLAVKMSKAMGEIGRVPKRGSNQAQGYKYARADDVAEHTREVLSKLGVAVYANVLESGERLAKKADGKDLRISWAKVAWTFVDSETGEERTVTIPGEGMDSGDKGIYKALTGSLKYALMLGFLIPTGDGDPERDDDDGNKASGVHAEAGRKPQSIVTPASSTSARLEAAKVYVLKLNNGNGLQAKAAIEKIIGRTFGQKPIADLTDKELELLEAHVALSRAANNVEQSPN